MTLLEAQPARSAASARLPKPIGETRIMIHYNRGIPTRIIHEGS